LTTTSLLDLWIISMWEVERKTIEREASDGSFRAGLQDLPPVDE
jgi:hypothetical protein